MGGKYNTRHPMRSNSHYPERLRKRGVSNVSVRMTDIETLRRRQRGGEAPADMELPRFQGKLRGKRVLPNNWRRKSED